MRALAAGLVTTLLLAASSAPAHVLLDAATAQDFLNRVTALNSVIARNESDQVKAESLYDLAETLGQVTELLNRDLASHGGEPSLLSGALVAELKARGIELSRSEALRRYPNYLAPAEEYLILAPHGARRPDALFRILSGRFYDSFVYDPMTPLDPNWSALEAQIETAERFVTLYPNHREREEARFILAVSYARAAREALGVKARRAYRERARAALKGFSESYPDSLRALATRVLMERLLPED